MRPPREPPIPTDSKTYIIFISSCANFILDPGLRFLLALMLEMNICHFLLRITEPKKICNKCTSSFTFNRISFSPIYIFEYFIFSFFLVRLLVQHHVFISIWKQFELRAFSANFSFCLFLKIETCETIDVTTISHTSKEPKRKGINSKIYTQKKRGEMEETGELHENKTEREIEYVKKVNIHFLFHISVFWANETLSQPIINDIGLTVSIEYLYLNIAHHDVYDEKSVNPWMNEKTESSHKAPYEITDMKKIVFCPHHFNTF